MTTNSSSPIHLVTPRSTGLAVDDTREQYRQKMARITLDSMVEFVGLLDVNGTVLEINQVALDAVGTNFSDVEGKPLWSTPWWQVSKETNGTLREAIHRAAQGEFVRWDSEIYGRSGGKETILIDASLKPVKDEQGKVVFIAVEGRDITEKRAHEREIARQREELARRQNEEHLRVAQTAAQLGTWEWDPAQGVSRLSSELHRIFGTNSGDPQSFKLWASRVDPADWSRVQQLMQESQRTGNMEFEYRYHHPELGLRTFYCKGRRLKNESRLFGVVLDITDRKQTEEALRHSEERFRAIVEATPECVKVVAADGTLLHMNSAGLGMIGVESLDSAVGKNVYDLVAPEHRERFQEFNQKICGGEKGTLQFDIISMQGVRRHLDTHAVPLRNEDGRMVHLGVTRDITERRGAEEAQRRLAAIVSSSDDAIASKDLNGVVTSWNKSAEKLFGYKAEEIIGQPVTLIIPTELHKDEAMILGKIRRGERIEHFETVRVTRTGERIHVSLTISPLKDEHGNVVGAAKIVRDITENKKIEKALRTTEKLAAAGRLAATVAHEINNPLAAVTNLIYLAKRDLPDVAKVAEHLQLADRELDRVAHIARQTLGFYRDTSAPTCFSVTQTLDDLLFLYEKRFETRHIKIIREYDSNVEITALAGEIRQAFSNLISNAIDAMPTGGSLMARVSKTRDWKQPDLPGVRITICDTGTGIEERHRKNLFQPFFTTKADVGTGLGLWITRNIIEKHRGTIQLKSRTGEKTHGTAFSLFLPCDLPCDTQTDWEKDSADNKN